ncbi:unnamed protein product, partial [Ectocarpus sp. 12 AP-2014]
EDIKPITNKKEKHKATRHGANIAARIKTRPETTRQAAQGRLMLDSRDAAGLVDARASVCILPSRDTQGLKDARPTGARAPGRGATDVKTGGVCRGGVCGSGTGVDRHRRLPCGSASSSTLLLVICMLLPHAANGFVPVPSPSLRRQPRGRDGLRSGGRAGLPSATLGASSTTPRAAFSAHPADSAGHATFSDCHISSRHSCQSSLSMSSCSSGGQQQRRRRRLSRLAPASAAAEGAPESTGISGSTAAASGGRSRLSVVRLATGRVFRGVVAAALRAATPARCRRAAGGVLVSAAAFCVLRRPATAAAIGGAAAQRGRALVGMIPSSVGAAAGGVKQEMTLKSVAPKLALWFTLFVTSAAFHSAEIAITTLYPWKVKEFAEEEGMDSPFQVLNKDITRVLTTILMATTVCTIYNAALFTNLAIQMFGSAGLAYATAALTVTTLFFGELVPKALGVNNAEVVARRVLPIIIVLSVVLNPVAKTFTLISTLMLSMLGFKSTETGRVSEEELRLIVTGAKMSGGIESQEGMMIEGVLDLQDTKISEIMRPRVEVVAIEANSTMMDLYMLHQETKYSRIPVYSGEIDRISGVVLIKELLDFVQEPEKLTSVLVADETESTYFVPETMSVWNYPPAPAPLPQMRRRRLHMAIVVDEYGGTAGVVTLEDILEEVVGEIYDEKEDDDFREEEHYINVNEDGTFTIHGMADLEDVCTSLAFQEVNEDDLKEFGTLSGYLCSQAGEIPAVGDYVVVGGYMFTVTKADERRIEEVHGRLIGASDAPDAGGTGGSGKGGGGGGADQGGTGLQKGEDKGAAAVNADAAAAASKGSSQ